MTEDQTDTPERKCLQAIATRHLIQADYNGAELRLAPHLLFMRHGEPYIGAFNPGKAWRSDDERRLGYFKLAGLHNLMVIDQPFEPLETADTAPPRAEDQLVFAI